MPLYIALYNLTIKNWCCSMLTVPQLEMYYMPLLLSALIFPGFDSVLRDWISVPLSASV